VASLHALKVQVIAMPTLLLLVVVEDRMLVGMAAARVEVARRRSELEAKSTKAKFNGMAKNEHEKDIADSE